MPSVPQQPQRPSLIQLQDPENRSGLVLLASSEDESTSEGQIPPKEQQSNQLPSWRRRTFHKKHQNYNRSSLELSYLKGLLEKLPRHETNHVCTYDVWGKNASKYAMERPELSLSLATRRAYGRNFSSSYDRAAENIARSQFSLPYDAFLALESDSFYRNHNVVVCDGWLTTERHMTNNAALGSVDITQGPRNCRTLMHRCKIPLHSKLSSVIGRCLPRRITFIDCNRDEENHRCTMYLDGIAIEIQGDLYSKTDPGSAWQSIDCPIGSSKTN